MDDNSGLIVSQQGVSIHAAADYQKTIDTRWRFLDIESETEFSVSHADSGSSHYWIEKLLDHNLGYLPAFTFRQKSLDLGGLSSLFYRGQIIATKTSIYLRNLYVSGDPTTPIKLTGFLRVFACDISTEYQAPIEFAVPGAAINEPDVGMKILVRPTDIRSAEISDFSINTRAKALAIQQTGTRRAISPDFALTIVHNLGYPPTYFLAPMQTAAEFKAASAFADPLGMDTIFPMTAPSNARIQADTTTVIMKGAQSPLSGSFAFLITKEPQELAV